jgi:hypothetical protein
MRNWEVPGKSYSYSNCENQICLHEQQAMDELVKNPLYRGYVKIIPQRDEKGIGMNTFERKTHYDGKRGVHSIYNDPEESRCNKEIDFISQCSGLATEGYITLSDPPTNLREECIDDLIRHAAQNALR